MIDIKKHWFIEPSKVEELQIDRNPFSKTKQWLLDTKYILKATEHKPDDMLLEKLEMAEIPVTEPIGNTVKDGQYYQLFEYIPCSGRLDYTDTGLAKAIGSTIGKIAQVDAIKGPDLKKRLYEIKCCVNKSTKPLFEHLEKHFFPYLPYYEKQFSHGDLHPSNLLWKNGKLKAVIDWEVAGVREELYDLAFLLGCIGMDNPANLKSKLVKTLIQSVPRPTKLGFLLLPQLMLATRVPWMYVWEQRAKDAEIAKMEADYWGIILNNIEDIRALWLSWAGDFKYTMNKWVMQDAFDTAEVNKAKKRMKNKDLDNLPLNAPPEELSADLRQLAIGFGMDDDILNLIKIIEVQRQISEKYPKNDQVQIERSLTMGNSTLDMSKFKLVNGMNEIKRQYLAHMKKHKTIDEVSIGYAFMLRNSSIMLAEVGRLDDSLCLIEEQISYAKKNPHIEIQGELARTLSNGITTCLSTRAHLNTVERYFMLLTDLNDKHKSKKIKVAYNIAKVNIKKADRFLN